MCCRSSSAGDGDRISNDGFRLRIERDLVQVRCANVRPIRDSKPVSGNADQPQAGAGGCGDHFGGTPDDSGFLLDRDPPEAHRAAAAAAKIEVLAVGGPDGVPVNVLVPGDRDDLTPFGGNRPDVPVVAFGESVAPERDPVSVGGPVRLNRIPTDVDRSALTVIDAHDVAMGCPSTCTADSHRRENDSGTRPD